MNAGTSLVYATIGLHQSLLVLDLNKFGYMNHLPWLHQGRHAVVEAAPRLNVQPCDITFDREPESDEVALECARICARPTSVWCLLGKRVVP